MINHKNKENLMLYVSKIVFNDGTVIKVSDLYNKKEETLNKEQLVDAFYYRLKPQLPLTRSAITEKTRNVKQSDRNLFLSTLVNQGKLITTKKGKKVTYYLPEQLPER
jgi:hypothetical protein